MHGYICIYIYIYICTFGCVMVCGLHLVCGRYFSTPKRSVKFERTAEAYADITSNRIHKTAAKPLMMRHSRGGIDHNAVRHHEVDKEPRTAAEPLAQAAANGTWLVTGAAGFIGFHTIQQLASHKNSVVGIDSFNSDYSPPLKFKRASLLTSQFPDKVRIIHGSACEEELLSRVLREHKVVRLLHLAAQVGVRDSPHYPLTYERNNVRCFISLLETLRSDQPTLPLVYTSSSSVYGLNRPKVKSNRNITDWPASVRASTKRSNEMTATRYHSLYGLRLTGLRFFTVYGEYGRPNMAYFSFSDRIFRNDTIQLYNGGQSMRDYTHVSDIVSGIIAAVQKSDNFDNEVFDLGNGHPHSVSELWSLLTQSLALKYDHVSLVQGKPKGEILKTYTSVDKAQRLLGYEPNVSLQEGVARFAKWYVQEYHDCVSS